MKYTRINFDLEITSRMKLEELTKHSGQKIAEIFRNAFLLYFLLWEETHKGSQIILRNPEGIEKEIIILELK